MNILCSSCLRYKAFPNGTKRSDGRPLCSGCFERISLQVKKENGRVNKHSKELKNNPDKYTESVLKRCSKNGD